MIVPQTIIETRRDGRTDVGWTLTACKQRGSADHTGTEAQSREAFDI